MEPCPDCKVSSWQFVRNQYGPSVVQGKLILSTKGIYECKWCKRPKYGPVQKKGTEG